MQHSSWHALIKEQLPEGYFGKINQFMEQVYAQGTVYPPKEKVFQALLTTPLEEVKVVILGQDPYHGPGQAQGLSFSVPDSIPAPPSLQNILKELSDDIGVKKSHDLTSWAEQGSLASQCLLDGSCWAGQWSCWADMGAIYRCCDSGCQSSRQTCSLCTLGCLCTQEEGLGYQSSPLGYRISPS